MFSKCARLPFLLCRLPCLSISLLRCFLIWMCYGTFKKGFFADLPSSWKAKRFNLYYLQVFASRLPLAWARSSSAAEWVVTTLHTRAAPPPTFQYMLCRRQTSLPRRFIAWQILFKWDWLWFNPGKGPIWNVCVSSSPSYLCCQCGTAALIGHEWLWDTIGIKRSRQLFTQEQVYSVSRDHLIYLIMNITE